MKRFSELELAYAPVLYETILELGYNHRRSIYCIGIVLITAQIGFLQNPKFSNRALCVPLAVVFAQSLPNCHNRDRKRERELSLLDHAKHTQKQCAYCNACM